MFKGTNSCHSTVVPSIALIYFLTKKKMAYGLSFLLAWCFIHF